VIFNTEINTIFINIVGEVTFVEDQAQYFDLLPFAYMPDTNLNVGQVDLSTR